MENEKKNGLIFLLTILFVTMCLNFTKIGCASLLLSYDIYLFTNFSIALFESNHKLVHLQPIKVHGHVDFHDFEIM